jgi:hypothetical protein
VENKNVQSRSACYADAFEARGVDVVKQEAAHKETAKVREDKAR